MSNDPKPDPPVETPDRATLAARLRELQQHLTLAGANWTGTKTGLSFMEDANLVRQAADALAAMAWQPIGDLPHQATNGDWIVVASAHNRYLRRTLSWSDGDWIDEHDNSQPLSDWGQFTHFLGLPPTPPTGRTEREG